MPDHIINTLFTASKPGCPNIIKCMALVREAIMLMWLKLFSIWDYTFPNIPLAVLIWLGWAGWPPAHFSGSFASTAVPKKLFDTDSWTPYSWHLQKNTHLTVIHGAHTLQMYIVPDAAVELYNNNQDISDEICPAEQVNRSYSLKYCGRKSELGAVLYIYADCILQTKSNLVTFQTDVKCSAASKCQFTHSYSTSVCLMSSMSAGGACKSQ